MFGLKKENTIKNTKTDFEKAKMVKSNDWKDRLEMAKEGDGLKVLTKDKDWSVRAAVARQGYGLDILVNDKDWKVRKAVLNYLKENNLTLAEWCERNNKEIDLRKLAFSPYLEVRFEAVRSGYIYKKDEIYINSNCKFIPYGTDPEKDKMVKSDDWEARLEMAKEGYGLDVLINDEFWLVRQAVANQGYGLNILINDENWEVRAAVAEQGYGLNILINDENLYVREAVAEQGYGLSILINDENWRVREAVAEQGYGLDILVNDKEWGVRWAVARQGYGLDILVNDKDWKVRKNALDYLKENNLTLVEWCNQNNKEIDLKNLAYSPYPEIRIVAIKLGYIYKENEIYIAPECKFTPYGTNPEKDKMVKSYYPKDRLEMAEEGYGLDILINDENWRVRRTVAEQGYGLNVLINDEDYDVVQEAVKNYLTSHNLTLEQWKSNQEHSKTNIINTKNFTPYGTDPEKDKMVNSDYLKNRFKMAKEGYGLDVLINDEAWGVRAAVAEQGYGLDILVNDEDWFVREAVAEQGYGLDILVNDEDWAVRAAVAEQGYGLDILVNDEDWFVREAVEYYLTSHNLTLEQWKSNQDPSELSVSTSKAEEFNPLDINTQKSEMQNLKDQINTLTKENKSLQEALENHTSLEKKNDGREL